MKKLTLIFAVAFFGCQTQTTDTPSEDTTRDALSGAWEMTGTHVIHNDSGDTLWTGTPTQYKLYVDGSVMWSAQAEPDSAEWFGYGTYAIDGDSLRETMTGGSHAFRKLMEDEGNSFSHSVTVSEDTYTQVRTVDTVSVYETYKRAQ